MIEIILRRKNTVLATIFLCSLVGVLVYPSLVSKKRSFSLSKKNKDIIIEIDKKINMSELDEPTRNNLLAKKASLLTLLRPEKGGLDEKNKDSAYEVFSIYKKIYETSTTSPQYKDLAIAGFTRVYIQRLFIPSLITQLPKDLSELYTKHQKELSSTEINVSYPKEYYTFLSEDTSPSPGERLASLLTFNDIIARVSNKNKKDTSVLTSSLLLKSYILRNYYFGTKNSTNIKINNEIKDLIISGLKSDLEATSSSTSLLDEGVTSSGLESLFAQAVGYDIYNYTKIMDGGLTIQQKDITKKNILDMYENSLRKIETYSPADQMSRDYIHALTIIWYVDALYRQGALRRNPSVTNILVTRFITDTSSHEELSTLFSKIFNNFVSGSRWERSIASFVFLSLSNEKLLKYMDSIGISKEKINTIK
jgi:hypothetical protein